MASLTGQLVSETYRALLKVIDNDILTASEKQITDGFGGGSNVFIDSQGFLRANKYKVTNGLATQFLKADGSLDTNTYLTSITGAQVITALGYTPVPTTRTITINGETHNLAADNTWTIGGTAAIWGNITGTLSNQTDLQNALNAKFDDPTGNTTQYIDGTGALQTFPTMLSSDNLIKLVRNQSGGTMTAGTIVYINGATGNKPTIAKALATSDATSAQTYGMVQANIANNADGYIVVIGNVNDLDTHSLTEGAQLYLSATTAGAWTTTKQYAPAHLVYVGIVLRSHPTQGIIGVKIQNGYELDELHDVSAQSPTNNDGIFFEASTSLWKNKSIATVLGYTPQAQLSGTGFVKASGTTISYDNSMYLTTADAASTYQTLANLSTDLATSATKYPSVNAVIAGLATKQPLDADLTAIAALAGTSGFLIKTAANTWSLDTNTYLTTATAASTYQRLDKMVSNLLASDTEYPNSNAVIAALALKANAENPVFTGYMTISGAEPKLYFTDTDQNPDYFIGADAGYFKIYDQTAGATRFQVNSDGNISTGVGKSITAGSFVKESGTAAQFLKADGSIDSNSYVTSASLSNYLLISTAASTYQRLDKMVSNLLPSSTEYPNSQAVINALALKADAANPVFTGNMTISGATPRLYFVDTDQNPDYTVFIDSGFFYIYDQTAGATRFSINSSGNISTGVGKSITAGSFVRDGGTASQYLMADGSVTTLSGLVSGSGTTNYLPKWTSGSALGNSILTESASGIGIGIASANGNLQFSNSTNTRKIVLYEGANNDFQFYGFGIESSTLVYSTFAIGDDHVFFSGRSTTSRYEIARLKGNGNALIAGTLNVKNAATNAGLSAAISATGEYMSVGALSGYFWENRSGGVTTNSNWYGWYTTSGAIKLFNGSTNLLSIDGSSGASTFDGNVTSKLYLGVSRDGSDTIGGGAYLVLSASSTSRQWIQQLTASNHMTYYHYNGSAWIQPISFMASGNILIGTVTDSGYKLDVNGSLRINGVNPSITTDSATDYTILNARKNGTRTWQIDSVSGNFWLYMQGAGNYAFTVAANGAANFLNTLTTGGSAYFGSDVFTYNNGGIFFSGFGSYSSGIFQNGSGLNLQVSGLPVLKLAYTTGNATFTGGVKLGSSIYSDFTYRSLYVGKRPYNDSYSIININPTNDNNGFDLQVFDNGTSGSQFLAINNNRDNSVYLKIYGNGNVNIGATTDAGAKFRSHYDGGNGSSGLNAYNILATTPSTSSAYQATIGAIHPGDGYANLNLGGNGVFWHISKRTASADANQLEYYYNNGSGFISRFIFSTSGNLTATAFFEASDMRLKKLIEHNPIVAGIENLEAKLYEKEGKIEIGYFAQDAELIMPYAVTKGSGGFLSLSYREIHTAKIARLEKEVAELKQKLNVA